MNDQIFRALFIGLMLDAHQWCQDHCQCPTLLDHQRGFHKFLMAHIDSFVFDPDKEPTEFQKRCSELLDFPIDMCVILCATNMHEGMPCDCEDCLSIDQEWKEFDSPFKDIVQQVYVKISQRGC
jgi:hypothetical protein